ncbi:MAG: alkaline phosphatase family protein [Gemmatimonadetes bacterium]|nr:alkaline phosphatase family protein [Gemmatimonadota bacterium]
MRKVALPLLLCCALVATGLWARRAAARAWDALTRYDSPYALDNGLAQARPRTAQTRHVVLVLVDGLRDDASRGLPFLDSLRAIGADIHSHAGTPSLSLPGRATLLTGAWQEVHGQMTNFSPRPVAVGHLFDALHRAGMTGALAAGAATHTLFGTGHLSVVLAYPHHGGPGAPDFSAYERELHDAAASARTMLVRDRPNFMQIDLSITDEAAHAWGANSDEYRRAARLADGEIRAIAATLDLSQDALVVTADHGHLDVGGHGGSEPEVLDIPWVMAGRGIVAGARARGEQIDVAPTLAVLLGVEIPAMAEGKPLLDALTLSPAERAEAWRALAAQRGRSYARLYHVIGRTDAPPPDPDDVVTIPPMTDSAHIAHLDAAVARWRAAREARERSSRVPLAAALALLPLGLLAVAWRAGAVSGSEIGHAALGTVVALAVYGVFFRAAGLGYSFSDVNAEERLPAFFGRAMALAVACGAVGVAAATWWRVRGAERAGALALARLGLGVAAGTAYAFGVAALATHARYGVVMHWEVPNVFWGFGFYLDTLSLMAVAFMAPVLALLAVGLGRLRPAT